jgi:regulator of protease activity HflC (stomatin/prohibitin superfamily)
MNLAVVGLFGVVAFALIVFAAAGLKVVRPYEKGLVELFGRYQYTVESGSGGLCPSSSG